MKLTKYPYVKVVIWFSLVPVLVSFIWGGGAGLSVLIGGLDKISTSVTLVFVIGIAGSVLFFIPAFILSLVYSIFELYKGWFSYSVVSLFGGCGAYLWSLIIFDDSFIFFVLGTFSSFCMAYLVFPRNPVE